MYNYRNFQKGQKAVALGFNEKEDSAPKVLASGAGFMAEQIIDIAKENNIPVHRDGDLAQILSVLEIDSYIPIEVYGTVAKILSYIYEQNRIAKLRKMKK
jgi:flagellar biosynthesis protein